MKLVIFGATGGTGRLLVEQALAAGHEVVVLRRIRCWKTFSLSLHFSKMAYMLGFGRIRTARYARENSVTLTIMAELQR